MVPDRNPRTECGCQPVAFISSLAVTPPGRFSRSSIVLVLLPSRVPVALFAALGAFLAGVAFLADLPLVFATWAPCGATRAFLVAFGFSPVACAWAVPVSSAIDVFMFSLSAVITAVTTWITPVRRESKSILPETAKGDGWAMAAPGSWQQVAADGRARGKIRAQTGGRHRRVADPAQRRGGSSHRRYWSQNPASVAEAPGVSNRLPPSAPGRVWPVHRASSAGNIGGSYDSVESHDRP